MSKTLLNHKILGEKGKALVIVHGLFGSLDNWQTLAKQFAEEFKVVLVDQRNHGQSFKSDVFNYDVMAEDLKELLDQLRVENPVILGHSMGGKTAMRFAQKFPDAAEKIIVVDIGPKAYPPHHDVILEGLSAIDLTKVKSRTEAEDTLKKYVSEFAIRQFLLKNLYWEVPGEQLAWRINIPVLKREINEVLGKLPPDEVSLPTLFINGAKSNYIVEADFNAIQSQFTNSNIRTVADAGHWIHAEKPDLLFQLVKEFAQ
ncbi:MAG: alpha/beta fold hydrolase [Luteibaculaceae bacterium]